MADRLTIWLSNCGLPLSPIEIKGKGIFHSKSDLIDLRAIAKLSTSFRPGNLCFFGRFIFDLVTKSDIYEQASSFSLAMRCVLFPVRYRQLNGIIHLGRKFNKSSWKTENWTSGKVEHKKREKSNFFSVFFQAKEIKMVRSGR